MKPETGQSLPRGDSRTSDGGRRGESGPERFQGRTCSAVLRAHLGLLGDRRGSQGLERPSPPGKRPARCTFSTFFLNP